MKNVLMFLHYSYVLSLDPASLAVVYAAVIIVLNVFLLLIVLPLPIAISDFHHILCSSFEVKHQNFHPQS
jgi:hypothetical protein